MRLLVTIYNLLSLIEKSENDLSEKIDFAFQLGQKEVSEVENTEGGVKLIFANHTSVLLRGIKMNQVFKNTEI